MGPMTGRGRGMCILKLPAEPDKPVTGLAGRAGRPIGRPPQPEAELAQLRSQERQVQAVLGAIRGRLEMLETRQPRVAAGT